jgi:signal recognition particle receptor subunit beta
VAQLDFAERQLTLKLVYFGPPLSGKTTNLRALHQRVDHLNRGRLMTLDTRDDRTLFFDLLPIFFRTTSFSFRIKVYTVPGQPVHEATRKVVLAGADGVVFVADSGPEKAAANRESWHGLGASLRAHALERIPVIVQYNKRDVAATAVSCASGTAAPRRSPPRTRSQRSRRPRGTASTRWSSTSSARVPARSCSRTGRASRRRRRRSTTGWRSRRGSGSSCSWT